MKSAFYAVVVLCLLLCSWRGQCALSDTRVGFLADVHLQDIYATPDGMDTGIQPQLANGKPLLMRSMMAQLHSTRLFNENYFVFIAALDDMVRRGVKLVVLPGDFSDDGQPVNVLAVKRILDHYARTYGMRFYVINGNHDPVRPFSQPAGKTDFLAGDGQEFALHSNADSHCANERQARQQCSNAIANWGYREIMHTLADHGFTPHNNDLYYETPFTSPQQTGIAYDTRQLRWCDPNAASVCVSVPDSSYLVEPVKDLWLLAVDANVYIPKDYAKHIFNGSGNAGYNAMFSYKQPVLAWIKSVAQRAREQHKRLIAFSHFPATDFYDNSAEDMARLFGPGTMQSERLPTTETSARLADLGLQLHFAGHMHINDTGTVVSAAGNRLLNIQIPSLAAYRPAYKLLTFMSDNDVLISTETLDEVPGFNQLFEIYWREWKARKALGLANWNKQILDSKSYLAFTDQHLRQLVEQRFIPNEWPPQLVDYLRQHSLNEVLRQLDPARPVPAAAQVPAITLVYDFYRVKNAADTAMLEIDTAVYADMLPHYAVQACADSTTVSCQVRQLLTIMATMLKEEPTKALSFCWSGACSPMSFADSRF